jgi:hypothetical protein
MSLWPATAFHLWSLALLRCASLLVPQRARADWWREWRAEVWHVRSVCIQEQGSSWSAEQKVTAFCLGAFQDALCMRGESTTIHVPLATTRGSARRCLFWLAGAAVLSFGVALLLPAVRGELKPLSYKDARHLVLLQDAGSRVESLPTITAGQFGVWTKRRQNTFDEFAFYRIGRETLHDTRGTTGLAVAYGTPNVLSLLGLPLRFAAGVEEHAGLPRMILSDEVWRGQFGGDQHIAGQVVHLALRDVVVAGVMPAGGWRLPGRIDAWLLMPAERFAPKDLGFAFAHLNVATEGHRHNDRWHLSVPYADGSAHDLLCISLADLTDQPWNTFLLGLFLACLSLPATTSIPLGEYRVATDGVSWVLRLRRWAFLLGKVALLLPSVYFISLDLAHLVLVLNPVTAENLQLASCFLTGLFGLRWILRDQRQRCPMCLGKLTHPARVGEPSRNFLAWNGTELICVGGHGLLHIPELSTSWFSTQRWLYLDPSWEGLFSRPSLTSAGSL